MRINTLVAMFVVTAPLWAVASSAQTSPGMDKLTRTSRCSVAIFRFIGGQNTSSTLEMNNDGNWCWFDSYYRANNQYLSAYYVSVAIPPKHGRIQIGDIPNSKVRVAYQPAQGFVGSDSFTIHFGVADSDVAIAVNVSN